MKLPRSYNKKPKTLAIDCDGVLCTGEAWTPEDVLMAEPRLDVIAKINLLYQDHNIIIYTARRDELLPATLQWLRKHNVRYHSISNLKCPADLYVLDDKCINVDDFLTEEERVWPDK